MNTTSTSIRAGIDWGSSSFRAYRFDAQGGVIDTVQSGDGIKSVANDQYESLLFRHIGSWVNPGDSVLLSGMITSRSGWLETPYLSCPAQPAADPGQLQRLVARGVNLLFMPGLCQHQPEADVMRGEELQLLGAAGAITAPGGLAHTILPGTHSKWALTNQTSILAFSTIATGEIFDCLINHTLIGEFADKNSWDDGAFLQGVDLGYQASGIVSQLFTARAAVLLERLAKEQVFAYLSGLLIGNEIREGIVFFNTQRENGNSCKAFTLVGSIQLCEHYQCALQALGYQVIASHTDAAAEGFSSIVKNINTNNV